MLCDAGKLGEVVLTVPDTCVLLKPRVSDVIMDLRAEKLFSAHWTESIDSEFMRNMQKVYGFETSRALRRLLAMKARCPEWEVSMVGKFADGAVRVRHTFASVKPQR